MTNPFHTSLEEHLRGRRVRAVSNDGTTFEGWVDRIHHHDRHVVLLDAINEDRDQEVGVVLVSHADTIETLDEDATIERVHVGDVHPSPYHTGDFAASENRGYIADVRDKGFVGSYPVVRTTGAGLEVVEGHKRLWACRQAGLETHPVRIVDVDDWTATRRFVVDHYPDPGQVTDNGTHSGCYEGDQLESSIQTLVDDWGGRASELDCVRFNADRLDLDVPWRDTGNENSRGAGLLEFASAEPCIEPVDDEETADVQRSEDDDDREDVDSLGTATVRSYGTFFASAVADFFNSTRVTVRERNGRYELAPGESDDWPDYAVGADQIQLGNPGVEVLGAEEGDELTVHPDGDVAVITVAGDDPQLADDIESSTDTAELVEFTDYSADPGNGSACQNCGAHVDPQFTRVFEPESEGGPRVCPNCEDLIRDGNGIREKRNGSTTNTDQEAADS